MAGAEGALAEVQRRGARAPIVALIVLGVLIYRTAVGSLKIAPTRLSKLNTLLEFAVLLLVMALAARWLRGGAWLTIGFAIVGATVVASGVQYAGLWSMKAIAKWRKSRSTVR